MLIVGEEKNLPTVAFSLLHPQQVVCHRHLPHLRAVVKLFAGLNFLRRFDIQFPFHRKRSKECVVLSRIDSLAKSQVVVVA